ncbi:MAG: autotransporter-associated beta strand repeat-containing protein [Akkermansiaceae bacterium]|jgi:autotransporter-associated beta strand protein|nr:autotransporter-associated beta strand repeat-containing protein [Akkermansiaceae bacterium]
MKPTLRPHLIVTAGVSGLLASTALAADQTWNTSGASDTWNTTDLNWDGALAWTNGNTAIFSGTGESISVGSVSTAGITFSGTGYVLGSGTITQSGSITANESATINSNIALTTGQSWSAAANKTLTLGGVISGSSTLTYGGSGSYVINGINTNSGNISIDGATVSVSSGATLFGSGLGWAFRSVTISNGGMLTATNFGNNAGNLWGQIGDGAGNIVLQSGGVFRMTGATMDSTVNKGIDVASGNTGYFRVLTGTSTVWNGRNTSRDFNTNTGSTLIFDGGGDFETSRYIRGGGNVTKNDGGTLKLTDTNAFTGTLTINGGTVEAAKTTTSGTASAIGGGSTGIVVNAGGTLLISGNRGTGYHNGSASINGGKITMNGDDLSFVNANTLTFSTAAGTIDGSGMWRRRESNNRILVESTASGSTISVANLNLFDSNPIIEVANGASAADLTISSNITGSSNLRKEGAGTLVISGVSTTYGGTTQVNAGTLQVDGTLSGNITVGNTGTLSGSGVLTGNVTVGGTLAAGNSPGSLEIDGDLTLSSTSVWNVEIGGTSVSSFDQIFNINQLNAGGTIAVSLINAFDPGLNDSFQIASFSSFVDNGYSFDFSGATLSSGLSWDTSSFSTNGTLVVVPEPSSLWLGGLGSLLLLRRRR